MGIVGTGLSASFQYDPSGRRVQKIVNGQPTEFLSDGVNPLQEQAVAGGNWTALMMLGLGVDEVLARADTSGVHYFLPDALGSTVFLTDAFGVTEAEYSYAPFGETTRTGTVTTNPFQFTGRENDNTGLYYYRARYYHPVLQRFLSEDPLEFLGGDLNLYAYVANNPILDVDPFGTTKGGKQRIFGDDPLLKDVSKSMSEAERKAKIEAIEKALQTQSMSKARAKALRGGLKVLKRGLRFGGIILFLLEELANPAEAGAPEDFLPPLEVEPTLPQSQLIPESQPIPDLPPPTSCRKC